MLRIFSEEDEASKYVKAFNKWVDDYKTITAITGDGCTLYGHYSEDAYLEIQIFGEKGKSF